MRSPVLKGWSGSRPLPCERTGRKHKAGRYREIWLLEEGCEAGGGPRRQSEGRRDDKDKVTAGETRGGGGWGSGDRPEQGTRLEKSEWREAFIPQPPLRIRKAPCTEEGFPQPKDREITCYGQIPAHPTDW